MKYKECIDKGFERTYGNDSVWFDEFGFQYFIVEKHLNDVLIVDWDVNTHELRLYKNNNFVRIITDEEFNLLNEVL